VSFAVTLHLGHFMEGLKADPKLGVLFRYGSTIECFGREHLTVGHVRVVRYREHLSSDRFLVVGKISP